MKHEKADPEAIKLIEQMRVFIPNRAAFPQEELDKYNDHWVAWSPDGTRIVAASKESEEAVYDLVKASGEDISRCVFGFVPDPNKTYLGW